MNMYMGTYNLKLFHIHINIYMNYYANLYTDEYDPDNVKVHIYVIEVVNSYVIEAYETTIHQKARVVCDVNITDSTLCKYVKQPYNIISNTDPTITLNTKNGEKTFTRLSHLLNTEGHSPERIEQISFVIHNVYNNSLIKSNRSCVGDWIGF
jgi:hypothetical protein